MAAVVGAPAGEVAPLFGVGLAGARRPGGGEVVGRVLGQSSRGGLSHE
ncbi:hypothetical protein ATKI12_0049 [Kitasatospora sp. Ki12]